MRFLLVSGKTALRKQIGSLTRIEGAVKDFIRTHSEYKGFFIYHDQSNPFRIRKAKKSARHIRNFIQKIEKKWGTIDILILFGGDDVIPFFRLDNPCDDEDEEVLSDNPYASRDNDFLIPERICARIPDNRSCEFMISQLNKLILNNKKSFGVSARVWQSAAKEVFKQIGRANGLKTSPPVKSKTFKTSWLQKKDILYFNLHGSRTSAHWYGQDGSNYPIALAPDNTQRASGIIAAECCYGAYIMKKTSKTALSLHLLEKKNVGAFCGSTTIAYGPVAPPSGEADLFVKYLFQYIKQGLTVGESFMNAKIDFARKMLRQQGFLDDDDQKTLLQFVLYGNPFCRIDHFKKGKGNRNHDRP